MGFWKKVDEEIKDSGIISRKTIAIETGIPIQTINRAIQRDSRIYLDVAIRVSKVFKKDITYFIDDAEILNLVASVKPEDVINSSISLYKKYRKLISNCELLSENDIKAVNQLATTLAEKSPEYLDK